MADMHCANQKATKMLKELEDKAGLIERQKQGQGKPTKIYLKDFTTELHDNGPDRKIVVTHENHALIILIITILILIIPIQSIYWQNQHLRR